MKPTDFPIERLSTLHGDMLARSANTHERARAATEDGKPAAGLFEAALAFAEAARHVNHATQQVLGDLDRAAAREQHPEPAWPLSRLENTVSIHREDSGALAPTEWRQRFPRWGVVHDGPEGETNTLYASPSSIPGEFLVAVTAGDGTEYGLDRAIAIRLDFEEWDQLCELVARIRAGRPVPYDTAGNVRTQEGTQ